MQSSDQTKAPSNESALINFQFWNDANLFVFRVESAIPFAVNPEGNLLLPSSTPRANPL
jgi:hypothetical protein